MVFRQRFKITGVENKITPADPITSTEAEKKRLLYIKLILSGIADNDIQIYHENTVVSEIPDRLLDYENLADVANQAKPGARVNELEVGFDIPVGHKVLAAIKCGATKKDVYGYYAYELIA
jgi:hypothetical protein